VASEEFFKSKLITASRAVKKALGVIRMSGHMFSYKVLCNSGEQRLITHCHPHYQGLQKMSLIDTYSLTGTSTGFARVEILNTHLVQFPLILQLPNQMRI
jgi:hypothetical protein